MVLIIRKFFNFFLGLLVLYGCYSSQALAQTVNAEGAICLPTAPFFSGCRTFQTQPSCDTVCAGPLVDEGCFNAAGQFVTQACVCSNSENSVAAITDIEASLGIDIDDSFVSAAGYQGAPPSINPVISRQDAERFFSAILSPEQTTLLLNTLNPDGGDVIDRNEASINKSDPQLQSAFGCNFWAIDNLLALIGLYLPNGSIDRYQGSFNPDIATALSGISRTFANPDAPLPSGNTENNAPVAPVAPVAPENIENNAPAVPENTGNNALPVPDNTGNNAPPAPENAVPPVPNN